VSVEVATSFPDRFRGGVRLLWRRGDEERPLVIAGSRPHGGRLLLRFEGIEDPETARALAGGELLVAGTEAVPAPEGFYYSHRIAGWRCENAAGRPLGVVEGLEQTAAGPLLTVATPEGKSVLVPFVASIVVEIDEAGGRVVIDPPEGLFEL